MNIEKLGQVLKLKYETAPKNEMVAQIHLFGIEYGKEIGINGYSPKEILKSSGIKGKYLTELYKGLKLSGFVSFRNDNITIEELSNILKSKYNNAVSSEAVNELFLFGIKYGRLIRAQKYRIAEIIEKAGLNKTLNIELNKAINLGRYVEVCRS